MNSDSRMARRFTTKVFDAPENHHCFPDSPLESGD